MFGSGVVQPFTQLGDGGAEVAKEGLGEADAVGPAEALALALGLGLSSVVVFAFEHEATEMVAAIKSSSEPRLFANTLTSFAADTTRLQKHDINW